MVASPKAVKLTEVHVRRDPTRLVRLSRLAAPLAEQAAISRAGAGALCLGVGGLEGGRGALAAGESGGIEEGGGDRWLVGEGRGIRGHGYEGGDRGGRCGANGGEEGVHVGGGETEQRGGKRERTGRRRGGGEGEEGGREGQRRERTEGVEGGKREFNYGLQDVDRSLAGSRLERARGAEKRGRQGQSVGHGMDTGEAGPMRKRNIDVSQAVSDRKMEEQSLRTSKQKAKKMER